MTGKLPRSPYTVHTQCNDCDFCTSIIGYLPHPVYLILSLIFSCAETILYRNDGLHLPRRDERLLMIRWL
jgi:hypothetical protein